MADDLRAALRWSAGRQTRHAEAHQLAVRLAELTYARGKLSEAQERYEEAAALADDPGRSRRGAPPRPQCVAWGRHAGNEAIRLFRAAAEAARRAGDPPRAALELTSAAEVITNAPGVMSELAPPGEERALLAEASALAAGDVQVEAAALTVTTAADESDPAYAALAERAVELAHRVGDARLESHALDQLTAVHLICGELDEAVATVQRRLDLLAPRANDVEMAWEYPDTLHMAPMVYVAAGDLEAARRYAQQRSELPLLPRGGPPRRRVAADHGGDRRRLRRGGRACAALPSGLDGGRQATARRHRLRPGRGGHGVRHPGRRRSPARVAPHLHRDAPRGEAHSR